MSTPDVLANWHRILKERDLDALDALLADDVVFHSPIVHTPQEGKAITKLYLSAAAGVLIGDRPVERGAGSGDGFRYVREVVGKHDAALEFTTTLDGIHVNGVDLIRWNDDGRITDFKVMIRPLKAIQKIHALMAQML